MKKLIKLTIIFTIILSLTFIPTFQTNAASKVNITYYAGKGHFKAKPNRSKNKITIKNKINKNKIIVNMPTIIFNAVRKPFLNTLSGTIHCIK